jgi:tetratricopeptide (TPR) repeat protein
MQFGQEDEAALLDRTDNPLNLAILAVSSGQFDAAGSHWERARSLLPNAILKSEDSLGILFALKRYDEAERLMLERRKRIPGDSLSLIGLAQIAEQRGDFDEAFKRWRVVKSRSAGTTKGHLGCARCLIRLGRLDEAETELRQAIRRDPLDFGLLAELAEISDRRRDWARSLEQWKHLAETHLLQRAFASAAAALIQLGRPDEAEDWLKEPATRFTRSVDIAVMYAEVAQTRGDLAAACERWATVRAIDQGSPRGYREGALRLAEFGRHAEADAVLRIANDRFPDEVWPTLEFANIAHARQDWNEAVARWEAVRRRFPRESAGYDRGSEALRAAGRDEEANALYRPF